MDQHLKLPKVHNSSKEYVLFINNNLKLAPPFGTYICVIIKKYGKEKETFWERLIMDDFTDYYLEGTFLCP